MKKQMILIALLALTLTACGAPPEDAARGEVLGDEVVASALDIPEVEAEAPGESVAINLETSSFEFEGYSPVKSHIGSFDIWSGELMLNEDGEIIGGKGTIDATSVESGIEGLNNHLKAEDFFDVENNPTIVFESTSLSEDKTTMTGNLTFLGTTKNISFPVEISENSISADFLLDVRPFGLKNENVNDEVRIDFTFSK